MTKKITIVAICCMGLMSSCEFSEECNYTGEVEVIMDWESLWGDLQKPDSLTALFYNGNQTVRKELLGDTVYHNIPAGDTQAILYNRSEQIETKGLESLNGAEIHLPTYFEGNIRAVKEAPMLCSVQNNIHVPIEGTAQWHASPLPIVKQLVFTVNVIRQGVMAELKACQASLSGIATGYSLYRKEPVTSKATVFFSLEKGKKESFNHRFFVLGVNPNQETIPKKLSVKVILEDGETKAAEIDLTEQFNQFTENIFQCNVEIIISSLSTEIEITDWKQGAWNQIIIQ